MLPPGDSFYIRLRGKSSGPYTRAQLRRMHEQGQLTSFHEVSDDGNRWALAGDLGFTASGGPPPLPGGDHGLGLPATAPSSTALTRWYLLDDNDQRHGPMTREQIQQLARQGAIPPTHLVWCEGWPNWVPLNQTDLAPAPVYYSAPAPAPVTMPAQGARPASRAAPAPMPRQAPQPAPGYSEPRPAPRDPRPAPAPQGKSPASPGGILTSWTFGVVVGLFLTLVGFAFLGLAVFEDQRARSPGKGTVTSKIDHGSGKPNMTEDEGEGRDGAKKSSPDRTFMWVYAATGVLFILFGVIVVFLSWRRRPVHE